VACLPPRYHLPISKANQRVRQKQDKANEILLQTARPKHLLIKPSIITVNNTNKASNWQSNSKGVCWLMTIDYIHVFAHSLERWQLQNIHGRKSNAIESDTFCKNSSTHYSSCFGRTLQSTGPAHESFVTMKTKTCNRWVYKLLLFAVRQYTWSCKWNCMIRWGQDRLAQ
jgi:hypothetical protein